MSDGTKYDGHADIPPLTGSKHWYDLSGPQQDEYLLACFKGESVRSEVERKFDIYDRIAFSISHVLLDRVDFQPADEKEALTVQVRRTLALKNTLLGERFLNALGRRSVMDRDSNVAPDDFDYTFEPMLFFDHLDLARTRGFESLSLNCVTKFSEALKESDRQPENSSKSKELTKAPTFLKAPPEKVESKSANLEPKVGFLRRFFSLTAGSIFVGTWILIPAVIGISQLAAVNQGLNSWGLPWWLSMVLAPVLGFIPIVGTIIGSIGAVVWGIHPVLAVILLLLPGRRQLILAVLSGSRRDKTDAQKIEWCRNCSHYRRSKEYEDISRGLWRLDSMPSSDKLPCNIVLEASPTWKHHFETPPKNRTLFPNNCTLFESRRSWRSR
jgi:hypothetical protein